MRTPLVLALLVSLAPAARADKPTLDEVKAAVTSWSDAYQQASEAGGDAPVAKLLATLLAAPFWYDAVAVDDACAKGWKKRGTVDAAHLAALLPCLATAAPYDPAYDGGWELLDVKHLPKPFRKHKTKLRKLAKDHTLAVWGWASAGPPAGFDVFAAKKDGDHVVIDAVLHAEIDQSGGM